MSTDNKNTNIKKSDQRRSKIRRQFGASLVEYGMLVVFISLAAYPSLRLTGGAVGLVFCKSIKLNNSPVKYDPSAGCINLTNPCLNGRTAVVYPNGSVACL